MLLLLPALMVDAGAWVHGTFDSRHSIPSQSGGLRSMTIENSSRQKNGGGGASALEMKVNDVLNFLIHFFLPFLFFAQF